MTDKKDRLSDYTEAGILDKNGRVSVVFCKSDKRIYVKKIVDSAAAKIYSSLMQLDSTAFPKIKEILPFEGFFVVIEQYITGRTISDIVTNDGALDSKTAADYIRSICRALRLLHKNGIIHRDITENNVMICDSGVIKLIDFNISHNADATRSKDTVVMGTSGYAAPEQFGFMRSDERTDIYSLGVLYNYMLTGTTELDSTKTTGDKNADIIIKKCTRFAPNDRVQSCDEILKMLENSNTYGGFKWTPLFVAALIFEVIVLCGCIISLKKGEPLSAQIMAFLDSFMLVILPFPIIGNWQDWQGETKLASLDTKGRKITSIIIYFIVLLLYICILR